MDNDTIVLIDLKRTVSTSTYILQGVIKVKVARFGVQKFFNFRY